MKSLAKGMEKAVHMKTHIHLEDLDLEDGNFDKINLMTMMKMCPKDKKKLQARIMMKA